jgi:hypothetical protein
VNTSMRLPVTASTFARRVCDMRNREEQRGGLSDANSAACPDG